MEAKTGGEELNGDRVPNKKQKQNELEQTRKRRDPKGTPEAVRSLIWALPWAKYTFYLHKTNVFACFLWVLLGGSMVGPGGSLGEPCVLLCVPWGGAFGGRWGTLRDNFWQTGGPDKSFVLLFKWAHLGSRKAPWGTLGERGGGQDGRRRVEWGPRRPQKNKNKTSRSRRGKEGTPRAPQRQYAH